jgi:hypothetical protein
MPAKHAGASSGASTSPSLSMRWWLSFVWIAQPAVSLVRQLATGWVASSFLAALALLSGSGAINHMSATRYSGSSPHFCLSCFACFCRVLSPCVEDAVRFHPKTKTKNIPTTTQTSTTCHKMRAAVFLTYLCFVLFCLFAFCESVYVFASSR